MFATPRTNQREKMGSVIEDLNNPLSLPDKTEHVSIVQTHISIVFVTDEFVYKVKKPVNFGFLDFSTLDNRKYFCDQEVSLNRRLARDIYLDVLPITLDGETHTLKGGQGNIVEYAVKMKRIPDDILMKSVFDKGKLSNRLLEKTAKILADFHLNAETSPEIEEFATAERFKVNTDENFEQVEKYIGATIEKKAYDEIKRWTENFYHLNNDLFLKRIGEGRIRDCHGDLHMEHICFTEELAVIDCIEFNDRFRYSDTLADIAFLLMDLEYHGGDEFSHFLWDAYREAANERDVDSLLNFYKVYRAFVRGKVNSFRIDDEAIGPDDKSEAIQTAGKYFQLAYSYVD